MTAARDHRAARTFLADASVPEDFAARALARIQAQDAELGTSYLWSSLGALTLELAEEAEDIAAWSALLAARLEHDANGSRADRLARALLIEATERAAQADALIAELRQLLTRERP